MPLTGQMPRWLPENALLWHASAWMTSQSDRLPREVEHKSTIS